MAVLVVRTLRYTTRRGSSCGSISTPVPRGYTEQKREGVWEEVAEVMPDCRELSERGECLIRSRDLLHLGMRQWRLVLVMEWDGGSGCGGSVEVQK